MMLRRALAVLATLFALGLLAGPASAQSFNLTVAVLVNPSNTAGFTEYQHYPERYLEHLQIPYETINVATTAPPADLASRQLIVAGHRGLALSGAWRTAIVNAVTGGAGFVNLDWSVDIGTASHIRTIFGATGSTAGDPGTSVVVPAAVVPGGATPHFIAALQKRFLGDPAGDIVYPFHDQSSSMAVTPTVLTSAPGTVIARVGTTPLILASTLNAGRAVNFGTYDYLKADRFGFVMGIDDLFWRSLVWAARKPFVLRGYPRFMAVQIDDTVDGFPTRIRDMYDQSLTGAQAADGTGGPWKVTAYVFTDRALSLSPDRAAMIADINADNLQVSPHAIHGDGGPDLYWKVPQTPPPTDSDWLSQLNNALDWIHGGGGTDTVPFTSKSMVPHWWTLANITGFDMWNSLGFRYLTLRQKPGFPLLQGSCCPDPNGRMFARPFRLYEVPPLGIIDDDYPLFFADDVTVGSRTGLPSQRFFHFTTSANRTGSPRYPRPDFTWPDDTRPWTVQQSVDQFKDWTWRLWSSQAPVNLYTHDSNNLLMSTPTERRAVIQQGAQWLAANGGRALFMEELGAYVYARTKSTLTRATSSGADVTLTYTGNATDADGGLVATGVYLFQGAGEGVLREVPGFTGGTTLTLTSTPTLAVSPTSLAFAAGVGTNPPQQSLHVLNTGGGTLTWTASDSAPWLSVAPASGTAPSVLTVSVNTTGLAVGTYAATITVTATGAAGSPASVPVSLTITQGSPNPVLQVSPTSLSVTGPTNVTLPPQTLSITNAGAGTLTWNATKDAAWMTLSATSGVAPSSITVTVNTTGLAAGTYNGTITVFAGGAANSPAAIPVTLTVGTTAGPPTITAISPTSGTTAGGTLLEIDGSGFVTGATVTVGGVAATNVTAVSFTRLTAVAPAGTAGPATVVVTTSGGSASTSYTYVTAASIFFADDFNDGNDTGWTISPLGLSAHWTVTNGQLAYDGAGHTQLWAGSASWTDYRVEAKFRLASLANYPGGVRGRVNTSTGTGYEAWFYPATNQITLFRVTGWHIDSPGLLQLGTASVPFNTATHTLALAFQGSTIQVFYDGALVITANDATYTAGAVALDVSNQPIVFDDVFVTKLAPPPPVVPTITTLSPTAGSTAGGTLLQVDGTGFVSGATVTVGGVAATNVTVVSSTRLTATVPAGAAGTASVSVTTSGGTATTAGAWTYVDAARVLFADDFNDGNSTGWTISPLGNAGGFSVVNGTLAYSGLGHTQLWAGNPAWTDYSVEVKFRLSTLQNAPGGLRGRLNTTTGTGYEAWFYPATNQIALFRLGGWSIDSPGLLQLGIASAVFDTTATHTIRLVFAGSAIGVDYDGTRIINATDTAYTAGAVALDVSNQPVVFDDVLVLAPASGPVSAPPTISLVSPTSGTTAGGTLLQIDGTGFVAGTTVTVGGAAATNVTVVSATRVTATVPPGLAGVVNLAVTTPGGTANTAYTYVDAARILFADDFNDGNSTGWTVSPLGNGGGFSVVNGMLNDSGIGHTQLYAGSTAWTNYTVEAKFRLSSLANYPGGLRGRVNTSTGVGYEAWFYPASNQITLFRVAGWSIDTAGLTQLGTASVTFEAGKNHTLALAFSGSSIDVYLDGSLIIAATDSQIPGGAIAIDVSNQPVAWDDVIVTTP